jgi:hypothetical protein
VHEHDHMNFLDAQVMLSSGCGVQQSLPKRAKCCRYYPTVVDQRVKGVFVVMLGNIDYSMVVEALLFFLLWAI